MPYKCDIILMFKKRLNQDKIQFNGYLIGYAKVDIDFYFILLQEANQ